MFDALLEAIGRLDVAAFQWLRAHQSPTLDALMAGLSDIARGGAIWIALAFLIAFLYKTRRPAVVQVLLAIALSFVMTDAIAKPFFNRSRPFETDIRSRVFGYRPTTRSFPSGHAASAVAGAWTLAKLAPEARVTFWLIAVLVAFSRVYLGVHYPGDVIGGAVLGMAVSAWVVGGTQWRWADTPAHRGDVTRGGRPTDATGPAPSTVERH